MADPTRQKLLEVGKKLLQERKSRVASSSSNNTSPALNTSTTPSTPDQQQQQQQHQQPQQQSTNVPAQNDELIRLTFKVSAQSRRIEELINENLQLQEALSKSDSERFKARCGVLEQENQELLAQLAAQQEDDKAGLISSLQRELLNEKEQHARTQIELTRLAERSHQKQLALDLQLEKQAATIEALTEQKITVRRELQERVDRLAEEKKRLEEDLNVRSQQAKEYFQVQQQLELTVREKDLELSGLQNELRRYQFGRDQALESEARREAGLRQTDEEKSETIARLQKKIEEDLADKHSLLAQLKTLRSQLRDADSLRESGRRTVLEQAELLSLMQLETEKKHRENQDRHEADTRIIQRLMEEKNALQATYEEKLCAARSETQARVKHFKDVEDQLVAEIERSSAAAAKASSERDLFFAECEDLRQQNSQLRSLLSQHLSSSHNPTPNPNPNPSQPEDSPQQPPINPDQTPDKNKDKEDKRVEENVLEPQSTGSNARDVEILRRDVEVLRREVESANQKITERDEVINKLTTEKLEIVLQLNSRTEELIQLRDKIRLLQKQQQEQQQQQPLAQGNPTRGGVVDSDSDEKKKEGPTTKESREDRPVEDEPEYEGTLESLQEKRIYQLLDEIEELKRRYSGEFPESSSTRSRAMSDAGDNGRRSYSRHTQLQKLTERTEALEKELVAQTKKNTLLLQEISLLRRRLSSSSSSLHFAAQNYHEIGTKRMSGADTDDIGSWLSFFPILGHLVSRKNFENTCELIV